MGLVFGNDVLGLVFVDYCGGRGGGTKKDMQTPRVPSRETYPIYLPPYPTLRTSLPTLKFWNVLVRLRPRKGLRPGGYI